MKYLSKITNSVYDDLKVEFLYHSNHLEGSTFSKDELDKLLNEKKVEGNHSLDDVIETRNSLEVFDQVIKDSEKLVNVFKKCQDRLSEKLCEYEGLLNKVEEEMDN